MEWVRLLLGFVEGIAWPLIVLLSLWMFRTPIASVIPNVIKVKGPAGTEIQMQVTQELLIAEAATNEELPGFDERLKQVEAQFQQEIESARLESDEAKNLVNELQSRVAQSETALYYERIHRVLYGTQISFLQQLNPAGAAGLDSQQAVGWFQEYVKRRWLVMPAPSSETIDVYLQFLRQEQLITQSADGSRFFITQRGRDFLTYTSSAGLSYAKPW